MTTNLEPELFAFGNLPTGLAAKPDREGKIATLGGIIRRDHRIGFGQVPFGAILLGAHLVIGHQVPLEHFEFLAAGQARNQVRFDLRAD